MQIQSFFGVTARESMQNNNMIWGNKAGPDRKTASSTWKLVPQCFLEDGDALRRLFYSLLDRLPMAHQGIQCLCEVLI